MTATNPTPGRRRAEWLGRLLSFAGMLAPSQLQSRWATAPGELTDRSEERGSLSPLAPRKGGDATLPRSTLSGVSRSNMSHATVANTSSLRVTCPRLRRTEHQR